MFHRDDDFDDESGRSDDGDDDSDETVPCPHCGDSVYEDAERCPHCGLYLSLEDDAQGRPRRPWWFVVGFLLSLAV
ncbi:zinc ribbon domain-containing protein, partial [Singulisphaera rosea]